jgi:CBS domain-containing protein
MTADPYTVTEDDSLESAIEVMERRKVNRLPVLRGGRLTGIVSRADLMRALAERARYAPGPAPDDGTIRNRILEALTDTHWAPKIDVGVHDGVAELSGIITDERERRALIVMAENVAGVKQVHDHLVWVEPMSGTAFASPEDEAKARTEDPARGAAH